VAPKVAFVPVPPPAAPSRPAPTATAAPARAAALGAIEVPVDAFRFGAGLAQLKAVLGSLMGEPVEAEHGLEQGCDTQQLTTTGLAYWRCASGTLGFVAFPDGAQHWAWTSVGVARWVGESADPPENAEILSTDVIAADVQVAPVPLAASDQPCLDVGVDTTSACVLGSGSSVLGFVAEAGATNAYRFDIGPAGAAIVALLTDLPADYDLYLLDDQAQVVAFSAEDGQAPESIALTINPGSFFLYVHSDPGRSVDAEMPYRLNLSISDLLATPGDGVEPGPPR
jgi:hypothetical protein